MEDIKFGSWLIDKKINGLNVSIDMSIKEYWNFADEILSKNQFQRKKVKSKGNTYSLLKRDLLEGCVMPPIILAVTEGFGNNEKKEIEQIVNGSNIDQIQNKFLNQFILEAMSKKELLILDGLQRTFTIQSAINEAKETEIDRLMNQKIRLEIYLGLSKVGILYRMFTLNTGQTPMSFRHQLEMLYNDYLNKNQLPDEVTVLKETDNSRAKSKGNYKYQDVIDMFYAYSTGMAQVVDKESLVSKVKEMKFLENYDSETEDMTILLLTYNKFIDKVNTLYESWRLDEDIARKVSQPFGKTVISIFNKSQAMTGFAAAISKLTDAGIFDNLSDVNKNIEDLAVSEEKIGMDSLIESLSDVTKNATKIGNAQREYFELAFRQLFNPDSSVYKDLDNCWMEAGEKYESLYKK